MTDPDVEEARQGEKLLGDLRQALLRLHKTLLDWERSGYERIHGRQSSHDLLQVLLNDPQFAWLRPMSQLIVRIDELLDDKTPPMRNDVEAIVAQVKMLTSPNEAGNTYERRYDMALQEHPDAVFAHRDVLAVFKQSVRE
ncbi:MAG: hypothetical protein EHM55_02285 [Acidobacteria bacterium]|nr:MAG: hypothetical protein EHM55_02285 [Acidobacteriota bacterium]